MAARPDLAGALDRILEDATSEVAAAGIPYDGEPPIHVSAVDVSFGELLTRRDLITLHSWQRCRKKAAGGYWREWTGVGARSFLAHLTVPPIARWTRDTITQVIAATRAELAARGGPRARCESP